VNFTEKKLLSAKESKNNSETEHENYKSSSEQVAQEVRTVFLRKLNQFLDKQEVSSCIKQGNFSDNNDG
jgi:capsid portal protein